MAALSLVEEQEWDEPSERPVQSMVLGYNADLIAEAARLYLRAGDVVVDVTFGKGGFWKKVDTGAFMLLASDLEADREEFAEGVAAQWRTMDLSATEYFDDSVDVWVLDPPYLRSANTHRTDVRYNANETAHSFTHAEIIDLYARGMIEARRCLRKGGLLLVKCMDEVQGNRQHWAHVEILTEAERIGFRGKDLFIFASHQAVTVASNRWDVQHHARKVHSYLWVLEKR